MPHDNEKQIARQLWGKLLTGASGEALGNLVAYSFEKKGKWNLKKQERRQFLIHVVNGLLLNYLNCFNSCETLLTNPANKYMFKVNNIYTKRRHEICSKLTIKTPEQRIFIVNFELNLHLFLVFPLLT